MGRRAWAAEPSDVRPDDWDQGEVRIVLPLLAAGAASRRPWAQFLEGLAAGIGRPVRALPAISPASLARSLAPGRFDLALLCGGLALDAVTGGHMRVFARPSRPEGERTDRALLLARRAPPRNALDDMLERPQHWRMAHGDPRSAAGFVMPQARLLLPRGVDMETAFRDRIVGTPIETSLAVVYGDADVATSSVADFERLRRQFPQEAARLQVIWESEPLPPPLFVIRRDSPAQLQRQARAFFLRYGRSASRRAQAERAVLRSIDAPGGYEQACNRDLLPAAQLARDLAWQRAMAGRWVDEPSRALRLARIDADHARLQALLQDEGTL